MAPPNRSLSPFGRAVAIALALMIALVSVPLAASSQAPAPEANLDLAALVLQPADLAEEGQPGYGTSYGWTMATVDAMVDPDVYLESRVWMNPARIPNAAATLAQSGWVRFHELMLAKPEDPGYSLAFHSSASSSIEVYASPEGAATAFAMLSAEPALKSGHTGDVTLPPVTTPIGDASVIATHSFLDSGMIHSGATQLVRIDNMILSVSLLDYGHDIAPNPALLDRMTTRLISRVQVARDNAAATPCLPIAPTALGGSIRAEFVTANALAMPGLDRCAQLLSGDAVSLDYASYSLLDGVVIPRFGNSPETVASVQAGADARQVTHAYQYAQGIEGPGGLTRVVVTLTVYESEAAAQADVAAAEQRLRDNERADVETFERNTSPLGDETYSYVETYAGSGTVGTGAYARLGNMTVGIVLIRIDGGPLLDEARAVLTSQVGCMQANSCLAPVPVPQELIWSA